MNELTVFENSNFGKVRVVMQDDEPWFVANDIAKALGYENLSRDVQRHCKHVKLLKGGESQHLTDSPRGINIIPESDVYYLIMKSTLVSSEEKQVMIEWFQSLGFLKEIVLSSRAEIEFLYVLEEVLKPMGFCGERQYSVGGYKVDYYISSLNTIIEYDENNHSGYNFNREEERERTIKSLLGCKIVRVSNKDSHYWNVGSVIKQILGVGNERINSF